MADPNLRPPFKRTGGPGSDDPSRFSAPRIDTVELLREAFGVDEDQISGPAWFNDLPRSRPFYAISATMPPETTKEQFQKMLQNLLVERFHLVFHREARGFPGYELVVDKGGPKFKEVAPTQDAKADAARDPRAVLSGPRGEDGFPSAPGPRTMSQFRPGGDMRWKYQERTMAEFLSNLGNLVGSSQGKGLNDPTPRVVDKTGLAGKYTFILEYYNPNAPNLGLARAGAASDSGNAAPPAASEPGSSLPNIFVALQKQLGLRLDKTADVPLDMIVVDSVDKTPTEN